MNPFVVSDSQDGLFHTCSRDHLDSVMTDWDVALIFADEPLMKSLLERAKRYPEVYVLICVDLLTKPEFAQTVGQQYKTRQQRADLFCPFKDSEVLIRPEDSDLNSPRIIRFTDALNESVMRRAVSIINEAPSNTPVHGPLKEKVARAHIRETAPHAVPTIAQYTADMGEVELTQVMANWMRFETLDQLTQYDELCERVEGITKQKFKHVIVDSERTEDSIRRSVIRRELSNAFISLKEKFGMTEASVFRDFPWMFNETLRAVKYDSGPPFFPFFFLVRINTSISNFIPGPETTVSRFVLCLVVAIVSTHVWLVAAIMLHGRLLLLDWAAFAFHT